MNNQYSKKLINCKFTRSEKYTTVNFLIYQSASYQWAVHRISYCVEARNAWFPHIPLSSPPSTRPLSLQKKEEKEKVRRELEWCVSCVEWKTLVLVQFFKMYKIVGYMSLCKCVLIVYVCECGCYFICVDCRDA